MRDFLRYSNTKLLIDVIIIVFRIHMIFVSMKQLLRVRKSCQVSNSHHGLPQGMSGWHRNTLLEPIIIHLKRLLRVQSPAR